jgi:hypothetical protein
MNFFARIGVCHKCMREAFLACLASWAFAAAGIFGVPILPIDLLLGLACLCTALWVLHMIVFAARWSLQPVRDAASALPPAFSRRRSFLRRFAYALAGVAVATAVPSAGFGQGRCPGQLTCAQTRCGDNGFWCCPRGYPVLNACNCRCYETLEGVHAAGCRTHNVCSSF